LIQHFIHGSVLLLVFHHFTSDAVQLVLGFLHLVEPVVTIVWISLDASFGLMEKAVRSIERRLVWSLWHE